MKLAGSKNFPAFLIPILILVLSEVLSAREGELWPLVLFPLRSYKLAQGGSVFV